MRPRSGKGWGINLQRKPFPCEFVRAKGRNSIFLSSGFIFCIITRLETLATEARWGGGGVAEERERRGREVMFCPIFSVENHLCAFIGHIVEKTGKIIERQ